MWNAECCRQIYCYWTISVSLSFLSFSPYIIMLQSICAMTRALSTNRIHFFASVTASFLVYSYSSFVVNHLFEIILPGVNFRKHILTLKVYIHPIPFGHFDSITYLAVHPAWSTDCIPYWQLEESWMSNHEVNMFVSSRIHDFNDSHIVHSYFKCRVLKIQIVAVFLNRIKHMTRNNLFYILRSLKKWCIGGLV